MKLNNEDINIDDAIKIADIDKIILKRRNNNFLLSDYQISVLNRFQIDYKNFTNVHELLFEIEEFLNELYDEELDNVGSQIGEYIYYNETKK